MITKHKGQKSLFTSFCLNSAWKVTFATNWNLAETTRVNQQTTKQSQRDNTMRLWIDRQVHSIKDVFILYFFLNTFLFQNTFIGVGCSISTYGISIRSALSSFSWDITIASWPGSPLLQEFFKNL